LEHIANSLGKIISQRSAFAFRNPARALAAGLPRQDHVSKTTDESFRNKKFDEMRCKLDSTENLRSFEKYPTPPQDREKKRICPGIVSCTILKTFFEKTIHFKGLLVLVVKASFSKEFRCEFHSRGEVYAGCRTNF